MQFSNEQQYKRLRIVIRGIVQGVGFRPFIYRLAEMLKLTGWVMNSMSGVVTEVEGEEETLKDFFRRIESDKPSQAVIQSIEHWFLDPKGFSGIEIRESDEHDRRTALMLPDIATCPDCLREIFDPLDRRYLYPFTNCTHCGPRFSIIESLPYDRENTTMRGFRMCSVCQQEYSDPHNRRFHAQPNACPLCGPHLELWNDSGSTLQQHHNALLAAAEEIRRGKIVAMKGIGGFHLLVDAGNNDAVKRLRARKRREEKPFALMFPSISMIRKNCEVSSQEERLFLSPESPIVLVRRNEDGRLISDSVAPSNPYLGIMLPYSPVHHILMSELAFPVVATSGNLSDEPICIHEHEAVQRLKGIADFFLVHNRPIRRHVDDSIARIILGREQILRRGRGYAPLPVPANCIEARNSSVLAVGAHLKNAVALSVDNNVIISQHIGDLETGEAFRAFVNVIDDFKRLYEVTPAAIVCDAHPEYLSGKYARSTGVKVEEVQHHCAHVASCMADNGLDGRVLGVSWDGTGYGFDGTIWGGEFFLATPASFKRVASIRPFPLPGGDHAIREPRRSALGVLYDLFGEELFARDDMFPLRQFSETECKLIRRMLGRRINTPVTSSAGRLFDAVSSIVNLRHRVNFEGQAAMELEFLADAGQVNNFSGLDDGYPVAISDTGTLLYFDWQPMILEILLDMQSGMNLQTISTKFHNTLSNGILEIAKRFGEKRVVLSGGCFQNRYLTERTVALLRYEGFQPYWHQRVPTNDGGIALGQIYTSLKKQELKNTISQTTHEVTADVSWNSR